MGYRKQLTSPRPRCSSSSHPNIPHETAPSRPPSSIIPRVYPSRSSSFVPPPSPSLLSKSGARRNGKQATPAPDNTQPPPSASSHPIAHRTVGHGTGNRTATGTDTETPHMTSAPTTSSKQDGTPDITASPLPRIEQARSGNGTR